MTGESARDAYERGEIVGEIKGRLDRHDAHFDSINGSVERLVGEVHSGTLATQKLAVQIAASEAAAIRTAAALREASVTAWTPWTRGFAALAALSTLLGIPLSILGTYLALR